MSPTEQRLAALATANRVRTARRVLKERVKSGELSLPRVLASPPPDCGGMRIEELLLASPVCGRVKADRILRSANVRADRRLDGLNRHERLRIVLAARDRYPALWRRWETEAAEVTA